MMSPNPAEVRQQTRLLADELGSPSEATRKSAAADLAKMSEQIHFADRPVVIDALRRMLKRGSTSSDFVFGLHALALIGSGKMPIFSSDVPIPGKEDCIRMVFNVCAMDWVDEQEVLPERTGTIALRAVLQLAEGASNEKLCNTFGKFLLDGNSRQKKLALNAVFSLDLSDSELVSAVIISNLDADFTVRTAAEETLRKITRHSEASFPKGIFLAQTPSQAKSALTNYLSRKGFPQGEHIGLIKKFAIIGAIRGFDRCNVLVDVLIERGIISKEDMDTHKNNAMRGNKKGDGLRKMDGRRRSLKEKAKVLSHETELLARQDGDSSQPFFQEGQNPPEAKGPSGSAQ